MIVITGYKGFIGSALVERLSAESKIIPVDMEDCFQFLHTFDSWESVETVYHFGAISSTTETDLEKLHLYNVKFTKDLFEKCMQYGIPVKYASSASVYGNLAPNINPLNHYAMSKATIDYWVQDNFSRFSSIAGYRLFNVYGKNEAHKGNQASPVYKFIDQCKKGEPIKVFVNSENYVRDFICVEDVVDVVIKKVDASAIYDLGTSNPLSFLDVAKKIANVYSGTIERIPFPSNLLRKYQFRTCARVAFDHRFKTLDEWLSTSLS